MAEIPPARSHHHSGDADTQAIGEIIAGNYQIGMDAAGIEKAMTTFGQVDSGLARRHEGTGLGLPLVQGLMQLHGRALDLTSEKGIGATVVATFPANRVMMPMFL